MRDTRSAVYLPGFPVLFYQESLVPYTVHDSLGIRPRFPLEGFQNCFRVPIFPLSADPVESPLRAYSLW